MNTNKWKRVATALAILGLPILAGCGQNQPIQNIPGGQYPGIPGGYIPGSPVGNGQCMPISMPIVFSGQGVYADYANIVGGRIPYSGQQIGQIFPGGAPGGVGGMMTYNTMPNRPDGAVTLTLGQNFGGQPYGGQVPYAGYPNQYTAPMPSQMPYMPWTGAQPGYVPQTWGPNLATIMGQIQISPMVQQDIMMRVQMGQIPIGYGQMGGMPGQFPGQMPGQMPFGYGQPGYGQNYYGQNICVSSIAMNMGKWDTQGLIYGGQIYLYLNGTMHGYVLHF